MKERAEIKSVDYSQFVWVVKTINSYWTISALPEV
ncbi:hypothetical protein C5S53_11650 [Methanophagales archaeon]|jgi:hypothetical protein|nr:hypothetical protein C5S53_11650 [Methanophagales archaeon]